MAPLSNEPDDIRVVLNPARRKAYYQLVSEITDYMRSQLELERRPEGFEYLDTSNSSAPPPAYSYSGTSTSTGASIRASFPPDQQEESPHEGDDGSATRQLPQHSPALVRLRKAALLHFDSWRTETLGKLREVVGKADDQKVIDARRKRAEAIKKNFATRVAASEDLLVFDDAPSSSSKRDGGDKKSKGGNNNDDDNDSNRELRISQKLYHPIPTRLTTIPLNDREAVLSAMMLLLLSAGNYSAYSRTLMCYIASALEIAPSALADEETAIATTMVETAQKATAAAAERGSGSMSADAEAQKRRDEGRAGRLWKVGLASVAGAAIVGVTGGLAAPVVAAAVGGLMGSVGLGGLASFLGIFWMNGALVGALFGAFGAKMTGEIVDQYAKEVEDFKFLPLGDDEWGPEFKPQHDKQVGKQKQPGSGSDVGDGSRRRLRVTIGINGWLETEDDVTKPWRVMGDDTEVFALRYEMASLLALGEQLRALVGSAAWGLVRAELLKRTVLMTLQGALWPIMLLNSAAAGVDNPFSLARHRSEKAGRVLADALINRVQGERPVTLVGYSLGARVIYSCLRALAARGAFGLVDTVVLIGAPVPSDEIHWAVMRSVVAGRLYNVHSANDYVLGLLYRSTSLQLGIAGLQAVGGGGANRQIIEGVEDLDLTDEVHGHLRYPDLIAQILFRCGFAGVKGGHDVIEKERTEAEEMIYLQDKDYAELGTLIDFGGEDGQSSTEDKGPRPLLPTGRTARDWENEKFQPVIKNHFEQKSDSRMLDIKLGKHGGSNSSLLNAMSKERPGPSAHDRLSTTSLPTSLSTLGMRGEEGGESRRASRPILNVEERTASAPPPHQATDAGSSRITSGLKSQHVHDDSDGEEDPITPVDDSDLSDGELMMVEPLSIDDEPLR